MSSGWIPLASWQSPTTVDWLGQKAQGLRLLPPAWVPAFIAWVPRDQVPPALAIQQERRERQLMDRLLRSGDRLLIRSDSPAEHKRPGAGRTSVIEPSAQDLVLRLAEEADPTSNWPLVQLAIEPAILGALSNDRRVSPRRDVWEAEGPIENLQPQLVRVRAASRIDQDVLVAPLRSADDLAPALRTVAGYLRDRASRYRVEWVWDGTVLWVVQADTVDPPVTDPLAVKLLAPRRSAAAAVRISTRQAEVEWSGPKAQSHADFRSLGLPTVPLYVAHGPQLESREAIDHWLRSILAESVDPIVLRTDVSEAADTAAMLPTSAPSKCLETLRRFALDAVATFEARGLHRGTFAILASPLLQAAASALVMAEPGSPCVEVDAIWGFPDGLLHLPHDSYTVHDDGVSATRRRKPACVLLSGAGARAEVPLGAPWDWAPVLSRDELAIVAAWAKKFAQHRKEAGRLMVLGRIRGARGGAGLLPFHWFGASAPTEREIATGAGRTLVIRGPEDVDPSGSLSRIELRPAFEYARSAPFFEKIGRFAHDRGVPIVFFGSKLGHARYILERAGAVVVSPESEPLAPSRPIIARTGSGILRVHHLDDDAARATLRAELGLADEGAPLDELMRRAADLRSHPSFPGIPWISDVAGVKLRAPARLGEAPGFDE